MSNRERIFAALQYIEKNLTNNLTIDNISHIACYSKYHFQRLFHASTGVTLAEYIQTRRVTESARLLQHSSHTVLQIALEYQFKSAQHFSRSFKNLFGLTPSQFRKKGWAKAPKFFDPFTIDDIALEQDRNDAFLRFLPHPLELVYAKEALATDGKSVHLLWEEMRSLFAGKETSLRGMITSPELITLDYPYRYSVIAQEPSDGLTEITLPETTLAEFRYVGAIQNLPNMYRYIYCVWMDREGYYNPCTFDIESLTPNFRGLSYDANEVIIHIPVAPL